MYTLLYVVIYHPLVSEIWLTIEIYRTEEEYRDVSIVKGGDIFYRPLCVPVDMF